MLKIFNSLNHQVEEFKPINSAHVGMYTCGPTVYDHMHIGNLRTFLFSDILYRVLKANGYQVTFIENITDIDDKIIKRADEKGISIQQLADEYTKYFLKDLLRLNITVPDVKPKATEHVGKMIKYIEKLLEKGYSYQEKDGSVYFDISKFSDYGKLSQLDKRQLKTGTRILSREARELRSSDEYSKEDVQDFALWKAVAANEVGWDSPWGRGRPGWHIECSVMSQEYLGDTFDVHAGGIDLLFPHHENEIAQSESKTGKKFVNYFIHGEHILVDGKKMSKSLKNFYTLQDLIDKGIDPMAYRYLVLTAHYRDKLNFTWQSLTAAQNALNNLRREIRAWEQPKENIGQFQQKFMESANNDLNMPKAVAVMQEMISSDMPTSQKSAELLQMDKILGLGLSEYIAKPVELSEEVKKLVETREQARRAGNFETSDQIRKQIKELGYEIEDTPSGPKLSK